MSFSDKITTQKGDLGESIVDEYIKAKGVIPYKPDADKAHPFDRLCASADKKSLYIAEVKSKAKRKLYPDTGIDVRHYNDYINIQNKYGINVFMFFVDEEMGSIYGETLNKISIECVCDHNGKLLNYPMTWGGIIYFPVSLMREIAKINDDSIRKLKELTTKNSEYI